MPEPHALIRASAITHMDRRRHILQDVDLQVAQGQIITLIGPNGAGKTTLVRILLGLIQPHAGVVTRQPGLRIGYMPQNMELQRTLPLTVSRFLRLCNNAGAWPLAPAVLARLGIDRLEQRQLAAVSGGELQRVLLARALLQDPDLLILDEPAQGVDVAGRAELYRLIAEERRRRGCGVLMISHDLHLVMSSTDEVVCLNHHVCCQGKPGQVSNDPAFLELFGPRISSNLAVYSHKHNHVHDLAGEVRPGSE